MGNTISNQLRKKITHAIILLRSIPLKEVEFLEIAYSGGKDSDVILQLAKEAQVRYRAIYKMTTIDPPGTLQHVRQMGAEVLRPEHNFFQLVQQYGLPSMYYRFCCWHLKEYKVHDKVVMGVRKSESVRRQKRYKEPTQCRWYGSKSDPDNHVEAIYPLLDWTDQDVLDFIRDRHLALAPVYYNEQGDIDITRRLGCMCCPLMYYKKRIAEFRRYPRMARAYLRAARVFYEHPDRGAQKRQMFSDIYEWFASNLLFVSFQKFDAYRQSHPDADYRAMLEAEIGISLDL